MQKYYTFQFKADDYDYGSTEWDCYREDGQNLTQKWLDDKKGLGAQAIIVRSNEELQAVNSNETDYLFGLFGETHIRFDDSRVPEEDPSLTEMTIKAIEVINTKRLSAHQFFYNADPYLYFPRSSFERYSLKC